MPKSRQRKKPRRPPRSKRSILNVERFGGDPRRAYLVETFASEFGAKDPEFKRIYALWCQRTDTCRVPYAAEMTPVEGGLLDMVIWASLEGGLEVPLDNIFMEFRNNLDLDPQRVEEALAGLAKAGIIGWDPGTAMVELRPVEKQE